MIDHVSLFPLAVILLGLLLWLLFTPNAFQHAGPGSYHRVSMVGFLMILAGLIVLTRDLSGVIFLH